MRSVWKKFDFKEFDEYPRKIKCMKNKFRNI